MPASTWRLDTRRLNHPALIGPAENTLYTRTGATITVSDRVPGQLFSDWA